MKNPFYFLIVLIGFAGWINFGAGCTNTAPPVVVPPSVVVPDSQFCKAIATVLPESAVGVKNALWTNGQTIRIGFLGDHPTRKKYFMDAITEWSKYANLKFTYPSAPPYDVRVSFANGDGSWSWIGTGAKARPANEPTIKIGWDGLGVCLHEVGHLIGLGHEMASPNSTLCYNKPVINKALAGSPNFWSQAQIDYNVYAKYDPKAVNASVYDPKSIMQYSLPDSWLIYSLPDCPIKNVPENTVLSDTDKSFMATLYPFPVAPPTGKTLTVAQVARLNTLLDECKKMLK